MNCFLVLQPIIIFDEDYFVNTDLECDEDEHEVEIELTRQANKTSSCLTSDTCTRTNVIECETRESEQSDSSDFSGNKTNVLSVDTEGIPVSTNSNQVKGETSHSRTDNSCHSQCCESSDADKSFQP